MFPQIKLLDLSSNSIFDSNIMDNCIKKKGKIVLFNNNIFITNNITAHITNNTIN